MRVEKGTVAKFGNKTVGQLQGSLNYTYWGYQTMQKKM